MGTWGPGIYDNDVAQDLKEVIRSVLRLPIEPDEVIEQVTRYEGAFNDPEDTDHTTSWFVLADMFHRYGIQHEPTIERVRRYIDDGRDLALMAELGMDPKEIYKRKRALTLLLGKISRPNERPVKRRTLAKPQRLIFSAGDLVTYPAQDGKSANPYFPSWDEENFKPNGFLAGLIVDAGHSFEYLAWYAFSLVNRVYVTKPTPDDCLDQELYGFLYGTLTPVHVKRMQMGVIAHLELVSASMRLQHKPEGSGIYTSPEYVTSSNIPIDTSLPGGGRTTLRDLAGVSLREVTGPKSLS